MHGADTFEIQEFAPQDLLGPLNEVESKFAPEPLYLIGDDSLLRVRSAGFCCRIESGLARCDEEGEETREGARVSRSGSRQRAGSGN